MFLIEPFIWMFSAENFKNHFLKLLLVGAVCWLAAFLLYLFGIGSNDFLINIVIWVIFIALIISPFLCLTGYFWYLTDNIIGRNTEPTLNSVYNGRVGLKNVITLPDWNIPRFIWRGVAAIVATTIMYIPFMLLMFLVTFNTALISEFWQLNPTQIMIITAVFAILFALLTPGLLWNYAKRDSVIAVLNIPKAVYLMETYTGKYFLNSFLIIVFSVLRSAVVRILLITFGLSTMFAAAATPAQYVSFLNIHFLAVCAITFIATFIIDTYWAFVYAYLLGTIAPPSEY